MTVDSDIIRVEPDTLLVTTLDEVQWQSANTRKFSIEFDGDGPFGSRRLAHGAATTRQRPAKQGRFKYTVVSDENPGLRLDPVIIVDPPPTGGTE